MSSSTPNNTQQLLRLLEDETPSVEVLEYLLEKLKRESLALIRQSEAACELFEARVNELEERVRELSEQEDFFKDRLVYWRQRCSDLEKSKDSEKRHLTDRIVRYIGEQMVSMEDERRLRSSIKEKDGRIQFLESLLAREDDDEKTNEPRSNEDSVVSGPLYSYSTFQAWPSPEPYEPSESQIPQWEIDVEQTYGDWGLDDGPENATVESEEPSEPQKPQWEISYDEQFGNNRNRGLDEGPQKSTVENKNPQGGETGNEEVADKLKAEVEMLRLQVKAHEEKERKREKLYAEFLRWAPKVQQEGWLTNKVRKAYEACQKIVEALDLGD